MKKIIAHSDNNFVKGFHRYTTLEKINKVESWEKLQEEMGEGDMKVIFNEFRIQNFTLTIEYRLVTLFEYLFNKNQLKESSVKSIYYESISRFQGVSSTEEAKQLLETEIEGDYSHMFSPHVTFYLAGLSLSSLIGILRDCVDGYEIPPKLLDKLMEFKQIRNLVIHNRLTSRQNVNEKIDDGVLLAQEIINLIPLKS